MLFNSYEFLFAFFPISLAVFFLCRRFGVRLGTWQFLLFAVFLCLVGCPFPASPAIVYNGQLYCRNDYRRLRRQRTTARGGMVDDRGDRAQSGRSRRVQIRVFRRYQCQCRIRNGFRSRQYYSAAGDFVLHLRTDQLSGRCPARTDAPVSVLCHYALFVSFFPRLVAGPIIRYNEIAPQFGASQPARAFADDLAVGLTIFVIGLLKKMVLADGVAPYAAPVFAAAEHGAAVDLLIAWGGALAYTLPALFRFFRLFRHGDRRGALFGIRCPIISIRPIKPPASSISGGAGTSPCHAFCATIYISRSAATGADRCGAI